MKAYLQTKEGFTRWFEVEEQAPVISMPEYSDIDFVTPIMSMSAEAVALNSMRKDFYLQRTFVNERDELVGIYKEK